MKPVKIANSGMLSLLFLLMAGCCEGIRPTSPHEFQVIVINMDTGKPVERGMITCRIFYDAMFCPHIFVKGKLDHRGQTVLVLPTSEAPPNSFPYNLSVCYEDKVDGIDIRIPMDYQDLRNPRYQVQTARNKNYSRPEEPFDLLVTFQLQRAIEVDQSTMTPEYQVP
jgi:hypothetical protein